MKKRQCVLSHRNERQEAWLDDRSDLKPGVYVTLKDSSDPTKYWLVESVSEISLEQKDIKGSHDSRKWHDNDLKRGTLKRVDNPK